MKSEIISTIIDDEIDIFENFIDSPGINWSENKNEIYHTILIRGRKDFRELLENSGVLNKYAFPDDTAIIALVTEDEKLLQDLIDNTELDLNKLFKIACKSGYLDAVNYMVNKDLVDPSMNYNAGLRYAALNSKADVYEYLKRDPRVRNNQDMSLPEYRVAPPEPKTRVSHLEPETEIVNED